VLFLQQAEYIALRFGFTAELPEDPFNTTLQVALLNATSPLPVFTDWPQK
jgi:hypothetical protein